jgi:hypothetical protein
MGFLRWMTMVLGRGQMDEWIPWMTILKIEREM